MSGVSYDMVIDNYLSSGGHVDFDLSINGIVVGSFTVLPGETLKSVSYTFPAITGPNYTIRLEETNQVDHGTGSIQVPLDVSALTFISSAPTLTIQASSPGFVTISWLPALPGYRLQENLDLMTTNWVDSLSSDTNPIVIQIASPCMFYRLLKP